MTRIEGNSPKVSFPTATPVSTTKLTYPRSSVWLSLAKIFADPVRVDKAMMCEFRSNLASPPPLTSMEKTILEDAQKSVAALGEPHPIPPLPPVLQLTPNSHRIQMVLRPLCDERLTTNFLRQRLQELEMGQSRGLGSRQHH